MTVYTGLIMPSKKSKMTPRSNASDAGGYVVQFRADDVLFSQLTVIANRLRTPPGVLARQWVAERVRKEIEQDKKGLEIWIQRRTPEIERRLRSDMEDGPVQIIHMVPTGSDISINLEKASPLSSLLSPAERIQARYLGRINIHGYITEKTFANSTKLNGYVQVFRSGQLESVRILQEDEKLKALYADQLDSDLIQAIWSYGLALHQLQVPLPIVLTAQFQNIKGYNLRTRGRATPTSPIDVDNFVLPTAEITDWSQVGKIEHVAQLLKPLLDVFWNAGGFERSLSFDAKGTWKGSGDKNRI
jgi:hypothetical protein